MYNSTEKIRSHKLELLENVAHALTRKVLSLETEIEVMKNKTETNKKVIKVTVSQKKVLSTSVT